MIARGSRRGGSNRRQGSGISFRPLATIEFDKESISSRNQVVILRQVMWSQGHAAREFSRQLRPIALRKRVEFVQQLLGSLSHRTRFAPGVLGVKSRIVCS